MNSTTMLAFCAKKMHRFFQQKNYIHVNDFRVETTTAKQLSMNKVIILSYQYLVKPPQKKILRSKQECSICTGMPTRHETWVVFKQKVW